MQQCEGRLVRNDNSNDERERGRDIHSFGLFERMHESFEKREKETAPLIEK